jgi:hypothetical protein
LSPEKIEWIVTSYAQVARPIFRQFYPARNSCVAAVRTTIEVFEALGLHSWPLSVRMKVEPVGKKVAYASGLLPEEKARVIRANKLHKWKGGEDRHTWNGHLVLQTEGHWFLDPTFDMAFEGLRQAGYPNDIDHFILLAKLEGELDPLGFHLESIWDIGNGDKLNVEYLASDNNAYRHEPAWEPDGMDLMAQFIIRAMNEHLGKAIVSSPTDLSKLPVQ